LSSIIFLAFIQRSFHGPLHLFTDVRRFLKAEERSIFPPRDAYWHLEKRSGFSSTRPFRPFFRSKDPLFSSADFDLLVQPTYFYNVTDDFFDPTGLFFSFGRIEKRHGRQFLTLPHPCFGGWLCGFFFSFFLPTSWYITMIWSRHPSSYWASCLLPKRPDPLEALPLSLSPFLIED